MADEESEPTIYAERMFPAPVDHGIAKDDRAVSTVTRVSTRPSWPPAERALVPGRWPGRGEGRRAPSPLIRRPAAWRRRATRSKPVKIGVLVDMDIGQLLADWIDAHDPRRRGRHERRRLRPAGRDHPRADAPWAACVRTT